MWVWDSREERIVNKTISYVPGLFKIFGKYKSLLPAAVQLSLLIGKININLHFSLCLYR